MNKKLLVLVVLISFILSFSIGREVGLKQGKILGTKTEVKSKIKIGAIYDLSGVFADGGKAFQEGSQIAVEEINSNGGINGRPLEVIYEDGTDLAAKPSVNAAQKLVNIDKVSAIATISYSGLAAVEQIATQTKVPVINTIDSSKQIGNLGDWTFGGGMYDDGIGIQIADFAVQKLRVKKVGMLVGKDEYVENVSNFFEQQFKTQGGTITDREEFVIGEKDFRTQMTKLKNTGAEAIFIGHLGEGGIAVKQAAELGFTGFFLGTDPFSIADVQRVAGSALNNRTYFALWKNFDQQTSEQKEFSKKYQAKFGKVPGDYMFYNILGYDGIKLIAEAIKNSNGSGESIKNALYKIQNFPGLSGPISIDQSGINRDPKSSIVKYNEDGKIVRAE